MLNVQSLPGAASGKRTPSFIHLVVYGGDLGGPKGFQAHARSAFPFDWPAPSSARQLVDGLSPQRGTNAIAFGRYTFGDVEGELVLAPAIQAMDGDHLIFRWRSDEREYAVSLHAWEPLTRAAATLRAIVAAVPAAHPSRNAERPTCRRPSPTFALGGDRRAPEVRGFAGRETLWALFFLPRESKWVDGSRAIFSGMRGKQVKIVWRVTGASRIRLVARGPSNQRVEPRWGPEPHQDSTWTRPGREWGTGFVFREAGCWRIDVTGSGVRGLVTLIAR